MTLSALIEELRDHLARHGDGPVEVAAVGTDLHEVTVAGQPAASWDPDEDELA